MRDFLPSSLINGRNLRALSFAIFSVGGGASLLFRIPRIWDIDGLSLLACIVVATIVFGLVAYVPSRWLVGRYLTWTSKQRAGAIAGSLIFGALWLFILPVSPAPQPRTTVNVEALGKHSASSQGSEVWLRMEADDKSVLPKDIRLFGDWVQDGDFVRSAGASGPNKVSWRGSAADIRLVFVSHPWSGIARVTVNGVSKDIDLFSATGDSRVLTLSGPERSSHFLQFAHRTGIRQWMVAIGDVMLAAFVLLAAFAALGRTTRGEAFADDRGSLWKESLALGAPLALTGILALLIFYPGPMTSDSLDQWQQAANGEYVDAHPLLYGLIMFASRSAGGGPALVSLAQLTFLSLSCGWLIAVVARACNAPSWSAWMASGVLALHPFVWLTSITLWKDVPYSACIVGLTAFTVHRCILLPKQRVSWPAVAALAVMMFGAMSLRHNGPPVALACVLLLLWQLRHSRARVIAAGVLAVILLMGVRGPVSDALEVRRTSLSYMIFAHHIGAHLARGHYPVAAADRQLLEGFNPTQPDWAYSCATVNPLIFNERFNQAEAQRHVSDLRRIWLELAQNRPDIEADHGICGSALIWRLNASAPLYLSSISIWAPEGKVRWIIPLHKDDPTEASLAPGFAQKIGHFLLRPELKRLYQPALYMYALVFACMLAVGRTGEKKLLLLLAIPATHTAFLAISIVAQDTRYQMPVMLVALCVVPLLALSRTTPLRPQGNVSQDLRM